MSITCLVLPGGSKGMRRYLALSRSTHGLLDMAMPCFVALLWLGHFPAWSVLGVALIAVFAGYTAIYALNDLLGISIDREKFAGSTLKSGYRVEASKLRHPLAQGKLSIVQGGLWFLFWYALALWAAWWLNPYVVLVVAAALVLEVIYCLLLRVTYWRVLVSGLVKAAGPLAAVMVVVPNPPLPWLTLLLVWLIVWEIGGQNIPADWNDLQEDRRVGARTIPVVLGPRRAGLVVFSLLVATVGLSLFLPLLSPLPLGFGYQLASLAAGLFLLLIPGFQLWSTLEGHYACKLFDRASLYPLALLLIIVVFVLSQ